MKRILLHKKLNQVMRRALLLCALVSITLLLIQSFLYVKQAIQAEAENQYHVIAGQFEKISNIVNDSRSHNTQEVLSDLQSMSFSHSTQLIPTSLLDQTDFVSPTINDFSMTYNLGQGVTYARHLLFNPSCLKCHDNAQPGDSAGLIKMQYRLANVQVSLVASIVSTLASIFFVMFFCYWVFRSFIQNQIEDAFDSLAHNINQISNHDDLNTKLSIPSDIDEVKQIEDAFNQKNQRLKLAYEEVAKLSVTDSLTGLYNRNKLTQVLQDEINRQKRYGTEFALVMMDLDGFKQINDSFGHDAGDQALIALSELIQGRLRPTDTAVRLGGDEFMIVLSHVTPEQAEQFSQSIQAQINGHLVEHEGNSFKLSTSVGIAFGRGFEDIEPLLQLSDKAMYANKSARKERMRARLN